MSSRTQVNLQATIPMTKNWFKTRDNVTGRVWISVKLLLTFSFKSCILIRLQVGQS